LAREKSPWNTCFERAIRLLEPRAHGPFRNRGFARRNFRFPLPLQPNHRLLTVNPSDSLSIRLGFRAFLCQSFGFTRKGLAQSLPYGKRPRLGCQRTEGKDSPKATLPFRESFFCERLSPRPNTMAIARRVVTPYEQLFCKIS
jgi:hypothetical protein